MFGYFPGRQSSLSISSASDTRQVMESQNWLRGWFQTLNLSFTFTITKGVCRSWYVWCNWFGASLQQVYNTERRRSGNICSHACPARARRVFSTERSKYWAGVKMCSGISSRCYFRDGLVFHIHLYVEASVGPTDWLCYFWIPRWSPIFLQHQAGHPRSPTPWSERPAAGTWLRVAAPQQPSVSSTTPQHRLCSMHWTQLAPRRVMVVPMGQTWWDSRGSPGGGRWTHRIWGRAPWYRAKWKHGRTTQSKNYFYLSSLFIDLIQSLFFVLSVIQEWKAHGQVYHNVYSVYLAYIRWIVTSFVYYVIMNYVMTSFSNLHSVIWCRGNITVSL